MILFLLIEDAWEEGKKQEEEKPILSRRLALERGQGEAMREQIFFISSGH